MTGLGMMLKSFGIKIDPAEVQQAFEAAKVLIPKIAADFEEIRAIQQRIEAKLDALIKEKADA